MTDHETIAELEERISLLYAALIRAELKAHCMREAKRICEEEKHDVE